MIKCDIMTSMHSEMEEFAIVGAYVPNTRIADIIELHRLHRILNSYIAIYTYFGVAFKINV